MTTPYSVDHITGLPLGAPQTAAMADPPARTAPITAFLDETHSDGIYRQPFSPGKYFDTDKDQT